MNKKFFISGLSAVVIAGGIFVLSNTLSYADGVSCGLESEPLVDGYIKPNMDNKKDTIDGESI